MGTKLQTKDGIKNVNYLDSRTAARVLSPQGWSRYIEGEVIRLQDFKTSFLERLVEVFDGN